ncbi:glycosyl hydrolase family 47 [Apiospora kogelbergensis]|uniref:glycosyl hydrolase family 47 n=1 Tax=Apiospora kogelbergensis TaxID=1337665 RepID=UPI003131193A
MLLSLFVLLLLKSDNTTPGFWKQLGKQDAGSSRPYSKPVITDPTVLNDDSYFWRKRPTRHPVASLRSFPTGKPLALPKVQASLPKENASDKQLRLQRQKAVETAFMRCWTSYSKHAWLQDELTPLSGAARNPFGGWAATLVDSLDTLHIMGLHGEFERAAAAAVNISFETSSLEQVNVFETTIRYLGGFLAAYDLSGDPRLLKKAREAGDMLYAAFDTPNRMPVTRWDFGKAAAGGPQEAADWALVAEIGSLCVEFTRLSLATGDARWFDASERITDALRAQQGRTQLPGLWPISVNPRDGVFTADNTFSLGAMADSVFEYLPKMAALAGGLLPHYRAMYEDAMATAIRQNFWRPMVPDEADILISSSVHTARDGATGAFTPSAERVGQHLVCFAGGMLALGGRLFQKPEHMEYAKKLVDGCVWTYRAVPSGMMPETFAMAPCPRLRHDRACPWDEAAWKRAVLREAGADEDADADDFASRADAVIRERRLPRGFTAIPDARYILRPEAIESVFVLYRTTGDRALLDTAWDMFSAIQRHTETAFANAALADVTGATPPQTDSMESFWMGETLKYFYLMFSEPNLVSLDEWVFNTEAHPLRRLVP